MEIQELLYKKIKECVWILVNWGNTGWEDLKTHPVSALCKSITASQSKPSRPRSQYTATLRKAKM